MRLLLALALVLGTATIVRADGPPKPTDLVDYDKGKDVQIAPGGTAWPAWSTSASS